MIRTSIFSFSLLFALAACQSPAPETPEEASAPEEPVTQPENDAPESYERDGLKIYPKAEILKFEKARLSLKTPEDMAVLAGPELNFSFEVNGYKLGAQTDAGAGLANSDKGQHIHLIVDNGPYSAHYEPDFTRELDPGHHYAIAFLSRSYHESIKTPGASEVFQFYVGEEVEEPKMIDLEQPLLFYSRPKGTYSGEDTKKVLFDFYLHNAELSADGYSVLVTVNDNQEFEFDTWQPYIIEGLPMGENSITIQLVDGTGTPVNSERNTVTRKFTLEE